MRVVTVQGLERWEGLFASRTRCDVGADLAWIMALTNTPGLITFAGGFPDPATFPGDVVSSILTDLMEAGDASPLQYSPVAGLPDTRAFISDRLELLESARPAETELLVTSGGIEALELIGKSFLDPGDLALVEAPTYLGGIMAFRSFEAQVVGLRMDDEGLEPEPLERLLAGGARPKLLYTIPDHQNPSGVSLSLERREALVAIARRYGFLIVEDVAYRELGFEDERPASLWSLAPDVVVQIGTFSKTFFPGVRLGWAAGPAPVVSQMTWAKQNTDQGAGALGQRLLEEFGRRGHLDGHIERARALYARRGQLMLDALTQLMPPGITWTTPRGGFFSWLTLGPEHDARKLAERAVEAGVGFVPGNPFFPDERGSHNIRLSFSKVEDNDITRGIERLAQLLRR